MGNGKWAGSWAGSRQNGPRSNRPYTFKELDMLVDLHLAALREYGAGHRTTEAHRESLERAIASYNATHKRPAVVSVQLGDDDRAEVKFEGPQEGRD